MIIGSSYIRRLKQSLDKQGVPIPPNVRLHGFGGLTMSRLRAKLDKKLSRQGQGNLVLHLGGNDIGSCEELVWIEELREQFWYIKASFPGYNVFWSDMTPRTNWLDKNVQQMEKKRKRANIRARKLFYKEGNGVIRHPEMQSDPSMLDDDGVHYSPWGHVMFWGDFRAYFNF